MNDLCSQVQFNSSMLFTKMQHYNLRQIVCWYLESQWTMWVWAAPLGYLAPKARVRSQAMRYAKKADGKNDLSAAFKLSKTSDSQTKMESV